MLVPRDQHNSGTGSTSAVSIKPNIASSIYDTQQRRLIANLKDQNPNVLLS